MMFDLENSLKCKADISNQLNKKFAESRTKADKDNAATKKAEIKSWKKELGKEKKETRLSKVFSLERLQKDFGSEKSGKKILVGIFFVLNTFWVPNKF